MKENEVWLLADAASAIATQAYEVKHVKVE